jgi:hypothetical protein
MLTADVGSALITLLIGVIDAGVWAVAMGRIAWRTSVTWKHGWWSRIGWMLAASFITWTLTPSVAVPVGALTAIWRTRAPESKPSPDLIPMAEGYSTEREDKNP